MKTLWSVALLIVVFVTNARAEKQDVTFRAADGFTLKGTFYSAERPAPGLLLLHQCDGDRHIYDQLATMLNTARYNVLTFDFRGFGNSRKVNKNFWTKPQNSTLKGALRRPPPETIDHKDFSQTYYLNLVNDVAAAKALDDPRHRGGDDGGFHRRQEHREHDTVEDPALARVVARVHRLASPRPLT